MAIIRRRTVADRLSGPDYCRDPSASNGGGDEGGEMASVMVLGLIAVRVGGCSETTPELGTAVVLAVAHCCCWCMVVCCQENEKLLRGD